MDRQMKISKKINNAWVISTYCLNATYLFIKQDAIIKIAYKKFFTIYSTNIIYIHTTYCIQNL